MSQSTRNRVARRGFLKGAMGGAVEFAAQASAAQAQTPTAPAPSEVRVIDRPVSDFMVDVVKSLGIEYNFAMPGSSFAAIH